MLPPNMLSTNLTGQGRRTRQSLVSKQTTLWLVTKVPCMAKHVCRQLLPTDAHAHMPLKAWAPSAGLLNIFTLLQHGMHSTEMTQKTGTTITCNVFGEPLSAPAIWVL